MALARRPIEKWVATLGEPKRYRPAGEPEAATVNGHAGVRLRHVRRRRLMLARWLGESFVAYAVHDVGARAPVFVHLVMVLVSGAWNNIRSMITGRYAIELEGEKP